LEHLHGRKTWYYLYEDAMQKIELSAVCSSVHYKSLKKLNIASETTINDCNKSWPRWPNVNARCLVYGRFGSKFKSRTGKLSTALQTVRQRFDIYASF